MPKSLRPCPETLLGETLAVIKENMGTLRFGDYAMGVWADGERKGQYFIYHRRNRDFENLFFEDFPQAWEAALDLIRPPYPAGLAEALPDECWGCKGTNILALTNGRWWCEDCVCQGQIPITEIETIMGSEEIAGEHPDPDPAQEDSWCQGSTGAMVVTLDVDEETGECNFGHLKRGSPEHYEATQEFDRRTREMQEKDQDDADRD